MSEPLVIEVLRGGDVESRHEVDVVAVDANGAIEWSRGAGTRPTMPRSALKPIQAVPLVATGAADRFATTDERLAIACGSHGGEPQHVALTQGWLADLGCRIDDLECGSDPPVHRPSADALAAAGTAPTAIHNTCSGKHAGFLSICRHLDLATAGYIDPSHPLQAMHLTPAVEAWCGVSFDDATPAIDGCGIPLWTMPLDRLAAGWSALAADPTGDRIYSAMVAAPDMVAGTGRLCTKVMAESLDVVVKTGAEGVYCGLDRRSGVAIALKARDGATRAAEMAILWAMAELGAMERPEPVELRNSAGVAVGAVQVAA